MADEVNVPDDVEIIGADKQIDGNELVHHLRAGDVLTAEDLTGPLELGELEPLVKDLQSNEAIEAGHSTIYVDEADKIGITEGAVDVTELKGKHGLVEVHKTPSGVSIADCQNILTAGQDGKRLVSAAVVISGNSEYLLVATSEAPVLTPKEAKESIAKAQAAEAQRGVEQTADIRDEMVEKQGAMTDAMSNMGKERMRAQQDEILQEHYPALARNGDSLASDGEVEAKVMKDVEAHQEDLNTMFDEFSLLLEQADRASLLEFTQAHGIALLNRHEGTAKFQAVNKSNVAADEDDFALAA